MEYRITVTLSFTGRNLVYHEDTTEAAFKVVAQTMSLFEHTTFTVLVERVEK